MKRFELFLNCWVQRRATTQREHSRMIGENTTNEPQFDFAKSFTAQLDDQLARRETALIPQVVIEVTKCHTQFVRHQPPNSALARSRWTDENQDWPAHPSSDLLQLVTQAH